MARKNKFRKSIWIPLALLVYSAVMFAYFMPRNHDVSDTYKIAVGALDVLLIVALWWVYRRRERLAKEREDEMDNNNSQK